MSYTLPAPPSLPLVPGEVRYVLEVYRGSQKIRAADIPLVSSIRQDLPLPATIERTLGGGVVRELGFARGSDGITRTGYPERTYVLTGSSGSEHRLGADEEGNSVFAGGLDLLFYFARFLELYAKEHADWEASMLTTSAQASVVGPPYSNEPTLVFRGLREGYEASVEASLTTDAQAPGILRPYTLSLRAYGPPPPQQLSALESFLGMVAGWSKTATDFVDSASAWVAYAAGVTGAVVTTAGTLTEPINAVGRLMEQVSAVGRQGRRLQEIPAQFVEAVFRAASAGATAAADIADAVTFGTLSEDLDDFRRDAAGRLNDARMKSLQYLGARGRRIDTTDTTSATAGAMYALTGSSGNAAVPVTTVVVNAGQSVTGIVRQAFGDLSRLGEVLALNDMPDPYTLATGAPVIPGSVIVIPAAAGTSVPGLGGIGDLFGTDLALSDDFDLIMLGTDDFVTVSGVANLEQNIRVRSTTHRGDYRVFPGVGLQIAVGSASSNVTPGQVASDVREQYTADRRVRAVGPVEVTVDVDRWIVECEVFPVSGDSIGVRAPLGV